MKYIMNGKDIDTLEKGGKIPLYLDDGTKTDVSLIIEENCAYLYNGFGCGEHIYLKSYTRIEDLYHIGFETDGIPQLITIHIGG